VAAADVYRCRTGGEFGRDITQRGNPIVDQVRRVRRAEEPFAALVHIGVVLAPSDSVAGRGGLDDPGRVVDGSVRDLEQPADERRAGFVGERDGKLRREVVSTG